MIEFRINTDPDQQFATVLNGKRVTIRLRYNTTSDRWSADISVDDVPVVHGRKVALGVDLLEAFDLGIGVIFAASIVVGAEPGRTQLPDGSVAVFHTTADEIASVLAA